MFLFSCSKSGTQVTQTLKISLTSPADNGTLKAGGNAQFIWSLSASDATTPVYYGMKIVEIVGNQSPDDAIRGNKPHFEKDSLIAFSMTISPSAGVPGFVLDKKYVWQVIGKQKTLSASSSLSSFTVVR